MEKNSNLPWITPEVYTLNQVTEVNIVLGVSNSRPQANQK